MHNFNCRPVFIKNPSRGNAIIKTVSVCIIILFHTNLKFFKEIETNI